MAILQDIVFLMIYCVIAFVVAEGLFGCWRYVKARRRAIGTSDAPQVEPEAEAEAALAPEEPARPLPEPPVSRLKSTTPVPRRRTRSRLFRRQSRRTSEQ